MIYFKGSTVNYLTVAKSSGLGFTLLGIIGTVVLSPMLFAIAGFVAPSHGSLAQASDLVSAQPDETIANLPNLLPAEVHEQLLHHVSNETGVPITSWSILTARAETWSDSCLGLGGPAELCLAVETPGWYVEVSDGTITRAYRTDETGQVIRQDSPVADVEEFPRLTARRVLDEVMQTSGIPLEQLDIVSAEPRTWDGCFGLAGPDQVCTQIAIMGWRVIVTAPDHVWIYHTNQDGTDIRLNDAASQLGTGTLVPEFIHEGSYPDCGGGS